MAAPMIHPVFRLAASQPQLVAEQAAAYASLVSEELTTHSAQLKRHLALQLEGAACLLVAIMLAGMALLLWASTPMTDIHAPWIFVVTILLPAALGLWLLWLAQGRETS